MSGEAEHQSCYGGHFFDLKQKKNSVPIWRALNWCFYTHSYTHLHTLARTHAQTPTHAPSLSLSHWTVTLFQFQVSPFFSAQELPEAPHVSVFLEMEPSFVGKWLWSSFGPVINPINYVKVFKAEERRSSSVKQVINPINYVKYFKLTRCRNIEEFIRLQMTVQYYQRYIDSVAQSSLLVIGSTWLSPLLALPCKMVTKKTASNRPNMLDVCIANNAEIRTQSNPEFYVGLLPEVRLRCRVA